MNFIKQIKRMFIAFRNILQAIFAKATKHTSIAVKTAGTIAATILTSIMVLLLIIMIFTIAIPIGFFNINQSTSIYQNENLD